MRLYLRYKKIGFSLFSIVGIVPTLHVTATSDAISVILLPVKVERNASWRARPGNNCALVLIGQYDVRRSSVCFYRVGPLLHNYRPENHPSTDKTLLVFAGVRVHKDIGIRKYGALRSLHKIQRLQFQIGRGCRWGKSKIIIFTQNNSVLARTRSRRCNELHSSRQEPQSKQIIM